jgi:hypothetical protein
MPRYPILYGFHDLIAGNGFVAAVALDGRALLTEEEGGFWMYGVNPGGLAAGGQTPGEAQSEFRLVYRSVLFDLAAECRDFEGFLGEVERFAGETNEPTLAEWLAAVEDVRSGRVEADWLSRKPAESRVGVTVTRVEQRPSPSANALDEAELAA